MSEVKSLKRKAEQRSGVDEPLSGVEETVNEPDQSVVTNPFTVLRKCYIRIMQELGELYHIPSQVNQLDQEELVIRLHSAIERVDKKLTLLEILEKYKNEAKGQLLKQICENRPNCIGAVYLPSDKLKSLFLSLFCKENEHPIVHMKDAGAYYLSNLFGRYKDLLPEQNSHIVSLNESSTKFLFIQRYNFTGTGKFIVLWWTTSSVVYTFDCNQFMTTLCGRNYNFPADLGKLTNDLDFHSLYRSKEAIEQIVQFRWRVFDGKGNDVIVHKLQDVKEGELAKGEGEHKKCSVCEEREAIIVLNCGHNDMCKTCCINWFKQNVSCPSCREPTTYFIRIYN